MITITIKGKEYEFNPAVIDDFLERNRYIRKQRISYDEFRQQLPAMTDANNLQVFTEIFISRANLCVQMDEELAFQQGSHGFYYDIWRALRHTGGEWGTTDPDEGVNVAAKFWNGLEEFEDMQLVKMAINGVDQKSLEGNSDGLTTENQNSESQADSSELPNSTSIEEGSPTSD